MMIRPTQLSVMSSGVYNLESDQSQLQTLASELSSGKAINQPSDNPAGAVQAMNLQSQITRSTQYATNASDGMGWLGSADSTLSSVQTQLQQVQTLVLQAANGATDANGRNAIASQINGIAQNILEQANTTYLNRPLFGGTAGVTAAYSATGAYQGNGGTLSRTIGPGQSVQVSLTGPQVFGSGSSNVFSTLTQIVSDIQSGNITALTSNDLPGLQAATSTVQDAQATVGARYKQLENVQNALTTQQSALQSSLASIADVDIAQATTQFTLQQTAYQAALKATSMMIQPSLASFLQ